MADKLDASVDLDGMTVAELRSLAAAAEAKAREKVEVEKDAVLDEARAKLAALGLSLESALKAKSGQGKKARRSSGDGGKLPVKYRGPDGQEWSGRGKIPLWLTEVEKQGRKREEFAV